MCAFRMLSSGRTGKDSRYCLPRQVRISKQSDLSVPFGADPERGAPRGNRTHALLLSGSDIG